MNYIERKTYKGSTEVGVFRTKVLQEPADLAEKLMRQLAIVAGSPDGEDSCGRQKLKLMPPNEVAKRACDIAEAAWEEFKNRNWILEIPAPKAAPEELADLSGLTTSQDAI